MDSFARLGRIRRQRREVGDEDAPTLPAGLIGLPKTAVTRRFVLTTSAKVGAILAVVPAAMVGLGSTPAEAAVPCINRNGIVNLDGKCYVSCVGRCSDVYSGCNSDPYRHHGNTIACRNGGGTGTPAKAVAKCNTQHPSSLGYGCCVYC